MKVIDRPIKLITANFNTMQYMEIYNMDLHVVCFILSTLALIGCNYMLINWLIDNICIHLMYRDN